MLSTVMEIMHQGGTGGKENSLKKVLHLLKLSLYKNVECPQRGHCDGRNWKMRFRSSVGAIVEKSGIFMVNLIHLVYSQIIM